MDTSKINIKNKEKYITSHIDKNTRNFYPILKFYKKYEDEYVDYYFSDGGNRGKIFMAELAKLFPRPFFMYKNNIYNFYNIESLLIYLSEEEPVMGSGPKAKKLQRLLDKTKDLTLNDYREG